VTQKILFATSMENNSLFKHRKYQNLRMNNKDRGDKYAICLHFFLTWWILARNLNF